MAADNTSKTAAKGNNIISPVKKLKWVKKTKCQSLQN